MTVSQYSGKSTATARSLPGDVESVLEPDAAAGDVAHLGAGGIVSRPRLFGRLGAARVSVVSAPAGSGKTMLLRSWIGQAGLAEHAAWVPVRRGERDPQRFWLSVLAALRRTVAGSALVQPLTIAPDLDGWVITERLLTDLAPLEDRLWLVIDDLHELGPEALRQLELLIMRAPPGLRFVLATRHEVRLGLHQLRLEGGLAEIRGRDLRFTVDEARELFDAVGIRLAGLAPLVERTEGWAAGLRLAALSLAGHPDPAQFAEQFSGSERTVAEYLLAEVLDRQSDPVRRLLLRTSVLDRVNGELADLLAGISGGERVLQDLEAANAFVVSLDARRSWFRYHHLFAGLLQLELRRTAPSEVAGLHRTAADWFAEHGFGVEAVRHAQAARDWPLAGRLLADAWSRLQLADEVATVHELLTGFPAGTWAADAELATMAAGDELARGSLGAAEQYLELAEQESASVPGNRRGQFRIILGVVRLLHARQRADPAAVAEVAQQLFDKADKVDARQGESGLGHELRALTAINLGMAEVWAAQHDEAEQHLRQGVALAHQTGWPYLELIGLAYQAAAENWRSFARGMELSRQVVELARRHGWTDEPAAVAAYTVLAEDLAWQARPEEAESWVQRAERAVRAETELVTALPVRHARGVLELVRGRYQGALAVFQAANELATHLAAPHLLSAPARALLVQTLARLGETERAEQALAGLGDKGCDGGAMRISLATLRLAQDNPHAAVAALAPVLDGLASAPWPGWLAQAFLLEATARDAVGDEGAAGRALERALDLAEPDGVLTIFLLHPAPGLLQRHARRCTAHSALIADILSLLAGRKPTPSAEPRPLLEALSGSEIRVLRYLPTNLPASQIAGELYVSANTVRTHVRHLYAKLGTHTRAEAVVRARALGLLAPSPLRGKATRPG
jgi:LuxR family transcriptional regulator, maltose regulon positive regulatory protein